MAVEIFSFFFYNKDHSKNTKSTYRYSNINYFYVPENQVALRYARLSCNSPSSKNLLLVQYFFEELFIKPNQKSAVTKYLLLLPPLYTENVRHCNANTPTYHQNLYNPSYVLSHIIISTN